MCNSYSFTCQSLKHGCENLSFAFCLYVHVSSLYAWKFTLNLNELKQILQNSIKIALFHLVPHEN